jgi:hypothetical protein
MSAPHYPGPGTARFVNLVLSGTKIVFTLLAPSTYKADDVAQVLYSFGWTTSAVTGDAGRFNATARRTGAATTMPSQIGLMQVLSAVRA